MRATKTAALKCSSVSVSTSRESGNLRHPNYADKIYFDHVLRTRADTWSNFAYVPVGFYGLAFGWRDLRGLRAAPTGYLGQTPALSFLFGASRDLRQSDQVAVKVQTVSIFRSEAVLAQEDLHRTGSWRAPDRHRAAKSSG